LQLHWFADAVARRIANDHEADLFEEPDPDPRARIDEAARPTIKVLPRTPDAAPLTFTFTPFPGVFVGAGRWAVDAFPPCGCDACDETFEEEAERLSWFVDQVTAGRFMEAVDASGSGDPVVRTWVGLGTGEIRGGGAVIDPTEARALLERGEARIDWRPWERRPGLTLPGGGS
jgi:hypothetical protein